MPAYMQTTCMPVPMEVRKGHLPLELGIMDGYELPYRCWEQGPSPLQEQHVLSTTSHLSSLPHLKKKY